MLARNQRSDFHPRFAMTLQMRGELITSCCIGTAARSPQVAYHRGAIAGVRRSHDDMTVQTGVSQHRPNNAIGCKRRERVERSSERSAEMIAIGKQRSFEDQMLVVAGNNRKVHRSGKRDFIEEKLLERGTRIPTGSQITHRCESSHAAGRTSKVRSDIRKAAPKGSGL